MPFWVIYSWEWLFMTISIRHVLATVWYSHWLKLIAQMLCNKVLQLKIWAQLHVMQCMLMPYCTTCSTENVRKFKKKHAKRDGNNRWFLLNGSKYCNQYMNKVANPETWAPVVFYFLHFSIQFWCHLFLKLIFTWRLFCDTLSHQPLLLLCCAMQDNVKVIVGTENIKLHQELQRHRNNTQIRK